MKRTALARLRLPLAACALLACATGSPGPDPAQPAGDGADREPDLGAALGVQDAFAHVARRVAPSVVSVSGWRREAAASDGPEARGPELHWREGDGYPGYRRLRTGSGFIVSADGYVLTAHHVLRDPKTGSESDLIDVELHGGRHLRARLAAAEPTLDLAILKIEPGAPLRPASLGDGDRVEVGHWAIALGDPEGPERTFAAGVVSRRPERECYQEQLTATLLQHSAQVPAEGHGGPLVNIRGEVIGMVRSRAPALEALGAPDPGAGYALPIDLAMTIYEPLVALESKRSPWLGFSVLPLDRELRLRLGRPRVVGIYIDDVFEPSPAAAAGVRVGDVLTRIDGQRVTSVSDFQRKLYLAGIGRPIALQIWRGGEYLEREVTVAERPAEAITR